MRTLVLGRTAVRVTAVVDTLRADGFSVEGVTTDEEARKLLETREFGVMVIGGGVGPDSRAALKELAAECGVRRVIDGALTEPFDAYVRRVFEPLIRETAAEG
ncbi:hypothetical protein [Streptomyces sp. CCM_MD2014]|uniref:hypothetical protein n=1 Tax=Streptomyces sp. CCM_MD2014 TaxID=1561022 RepID=UPI00052AB9E1|nr:hypothetical protein [Streptomyces sp. CCM_MD2014]AIV35531.1 hypothetical protein NI25_20135 [Streptomyces sp. CCM_MD2014]MDA4885925.1 hypothetical protein [Streptomyces sp. MS2A]